MAETPEVTTQPNYKCPACGSPNLGCCETPGGGTNRWRMICTDCRWMADYGSKSDVQALEDSKNLLLGWDRGERPEFSETLAADTEMVFRNRAAPLADAIRGNVNAGMPFRTDVAQKRFEEGKPVPFTAVCLVCRGQADGEEIAGGFFRYPTGWRRRHPDGAAVCSPACQEKAGGKAHSTKVFSCDNCQKQETGHVAGDLGFTGAGGFFGLPAGWWQQDPSLKLGCSVDCVDGMREVVP